MTDEPITSTPTRPPLTRERVFAAALQLIDERGLERFTMRALGARLGVEAMSIYKHLPGKQAVIDGVVELLLKEFEQAWFSVARPTCWRAHLREFAHTFRALSDAHPQAFPLLSQRTLRAYLVGRTLAEGALATLVSAGFSRMEAIDTLRLVVRFTLGFALSEPAEALPADPQGPLVGPEYPLVTELTAAVGDSVDEDRLFRSGVESLLTGISVSHERGAGPASEV